MDVSINWLLVIALTIAVWVVGFLWFVVIFGRAYMAGHGRTKAQLDAGPTMPVASLYQLIGSFLQVSILAWLVAAIDVTTAANGMLLGLLVWLGFIAAYILPMYAFQAYSLKYSAIVTGYPLVTFVAVGAILAIVS